MASFSSDSFSLDAFDLNAWDLDFLQEIFGEVISGPTKKAKRRWAVRRNGKTRLFDSVQELEDHLKEEPGERTVIREEGKKTVVLKSKHKLPDVEKVVSQWKLEAPQIALPTVDILRQPMQDANLVMPKKVDTDEEDFMEFLSIL